MPEANRKERKEDIINFVPLAVSCKRIKRRLAEE
jgi:hypothetical protein